MANGVLLLLTNAVLVVGTPAPLLDSSNSWGVIPVGDLGHVYSNHPISAGLLQLETRKATSNIIATWNREDTLSVGLVVGLIVLAVGTFFTKAHGSGNAAFAVAGFMACSSMMLIVNKIAITVLPFPATILALQLLSCAAGVRIAGMLGIIEVEPLQLVKVKQFGATPLAFLLTLVANIKILQYANVETFIMFRNATPLATSVLDWLFLGRELPNRQSILMILLALAGSIGYVVCDASFQMRAYVWAAAWLAIFLFDQVYIKHVISTVRMGNWTRVYYTNALAGIAAFAYVWVHESQFTALIHGWHGDILSGVLIISVSCAMGTAMSYFSFLARDALSATSFSIVGNVCKILTVLANVFLWDKHATAHGLMWLSLVIVSAVGYTQAPMRKNFDDEQLPLSSRSKI